MWKVSDLYPNYEVSDQGEVRNAKTKRLLSLKKRIRGYVYVHLHQDGKSKVVTVHRLVASAFIPNPNNLETVNHINYIKDDNRVENLEWMSYSENSSNKNPDKNPDKRIVSRQIEQLDLNGNILAEFDNISQAAKELQINRGNINQVCLGKLKTAGGYIFRYKCLTQIKCSAND